MKYHFKVHKEGSGFWARCIELKGCVTQGASLKELRHNMAEALNLYLSEPEDSRTVFSLPRRTAKKSGIESVKVDPGVALSMTLRQLRLKRHLTQNEVAQRLGFSRVWSYQKLETKSANPTWQTIDRLKEIFPELKIDALVG